MKTSPETQPEETLQATGSHQSREDDLSSESSLLSTDIIQCLLSMGNGGALKELRTKMLQNYEEFLSTSALGLCGHFLVFQKDRINFDI